jgi:hypothetical protein
MPFSSASGGIDQEVAEAQAMRRITASPNPLCRLRDACSFHEGGSMLSGYAKLKLSPLAVTCVGLFFAPLSCSEAVAQPHAGRIIGSLDGISQDGDHFFISGWACQQGQKKSIAVHVFADDPKASSKKIFLTAHFANLYSEPAVGQACQDQKAGQHRFVILLPYGYGPESVLYVNGIRAVDGVPNDAIAGSGRKLVKLEGLDLPYPSVPHLSGAYRSLDQHPRVFTTSAELKDLASRINRPGSYSNQRFGLLATKIGGDLSSGIDWDVTYSGCDGDIYQYVFSYEPQNNLEAAIRSALQISQGAKAPAGAAVVASRLALYAALVKAGADVPQGAPGAGEAAALAKRILLAWANRGFPRDDHGRILPLLSAHCAVSGKGDKGELAEGRGVLYSVHAQDLLQSFGALNGKEESQLNLFHGAMFELIRQSENAYFAGVAPCQRYSNISANALTSLLAIARLADNTGELNAVLYGGGHATPILLPWIRLFDRSIYGEADSVPQCGKNPFPDSLTSLANHSDFQSSNVVPGEINDRSRNAGPGNGIGYPMFTLERLFNTAEILRIAGFDPYGYRGAHRQSIEMAMQYYACFAKGAGFYNTVTAANSASCPNAAQYYGKLVNAVDQLVLIGAYRFPQNHSIMEVEAAAKAVASNGGFSTDAILFGKWRD